MIQQNIKLTVDAIVFGNRNEELHILLVQRKHDPFKGLWAIPGGFVEDDEDLEPAARRELQEETGVQLEQMEQLYTVGTPGRDPRGRTVSVVYYTPKPVQVGDLVVKADDDAADAQWFAVNSLPEIAFDHYDVIQRALQAIGF